MLVQYALSRIQLNNGGQVRRVLLLRVLHIGGGDSGHTALLADTFDNER